MSDEIVSALTGTGLSARERLTRPEGGLRGQIIEELGQQIVDGTLGEGDTVVADQICETFGVSRSVTREALRTLESMGLIQARQQIGTRVLGKDSWDLLNPRLVHWRGRGPDYLIQQRELLETRLGIEPTAAALGAERMDAATIDRLRLLVIQMRDSLERGDRLRHFRADGAFHRTLLEGAGNGVMARIADAIDAALDVRGETLRDGLAHVQPESIKWHESVVHALSRRDPQEAHDAARAILVHTLAELNAISDQ
ncbi:MAG: FCD domain-containing protein [Propionicimonas sp.]